MSNDGGDGTSTSNQSPAEARKSADLQSLLAQQPSPSTEKTSIADQTSNSSSSSTSTQTTTQPAPATATGLREDLIKLAVSFLSSPNVRSADTAKKVAFLRQKGLSQEEIETAFKRVGEDASVSTTSIQQSSLSSTPLAVVAGPPPRPAVPPRPAAMYQPQVVYYSPPPPPPMPLQRIVAMAVILGFGAVGITAAILKVIKRLVGPIFESIANYQRGRYSERTSLWKRFQDKLKEDDDDTREASTALAKKSESLSESLAKILDIARDRAEDVRDEPYSDLRDKLNDFKSSLSDPDHIFSSFSSYTPYPSIGGNSRESKAVQDFKSEVRSFKGMLLNRRNFPMVSTNSKPPLSPSALSPSTTAVRDVPIYHPRRRQSNRSEMAQETEPPQSSTTALEKNPV